MDALTAQQALHRCPRATLSHEQAALALGIDLVEGRTRRRLTVPRSASRVVLPGWEVVRRDLVPEERRTLADGSRVTAAARTVSDLVPDLGLAAVVVAADSALRQRLVSSAALVDVLLARRGPCVNRRREVAALLDPASGSVLESLLRVLLVISGLPAPRTQFLVVERGAELARVDFAWPELRLVVEADGFAFHSDREAYRRDRERMNALERLGWRVLRFTHEDVVGRPAYVVGLVRACLVAAT